jgi:hypothetical protein
MFCAGKFLICILERFCDYQKILAKLCVGIRWLCFLWQIAEQTAYFGVATFSALF